MSVYVNAESLLAKNLCVIFQAPLQTVSEVSPGRTWGKAALPTTDVERSLCIAVSARELQSRTQPSLVAYSLTLPPSPGASLLSALSHGLPRCLYQGLFIEGSGGNLKILSPSLTQYLTLFHSQGYPHSVLGPLGL